MREKTRRHRQLEILNSRYGLSSYEKEALKKLDAGFEGELIFDGILEKFIRGTNIVHIKDYNFHPEIIGRRMLTRSREEAAHVQIDNVVIARDFLYTFEIKNYSFDLEYTDSGWFFENGTEFADPLMQVMKQRNMLGKVVSGLGHQIRMFNVLVFINENQTIFNLPARSDVIVRSNLNKKLSKSMVGNHHNHSNLAADLESQRLTDMKYQGDTVVEFHDIKKGVFCAECGERLKRVNRYRYKCNSCSRETAVLNVLKQLIMELGILNRTWTITPSLIQSYSDDEISEYCVRDNKKRGLLQF